MAARRASVLIPSNRLTLLGGVKLASIRLAGLSSGGLDAKPLSSLIEARWLESDHIIGKL